MLRGVPRGWTKLVLHNGKRYACASLFLLLLAGISGLAAAQDVDVSIESLHISWVESATIQDRPSLDLDQALVGDTIRVSSDSPADIRTRKIELNGVVPGKGFGCCDKLRHFIM